MRAMFSHSLLYPARPLSSLLDARLVLPSPAGVPPVGFPSSSHQTAALPLFVPPMPDREAGAKLGRRPGVTEDHRRRRTDHTGRGE